MSLELNLITFEKENIDNECVDFESKLSPQVEIDESVSKEDFEKIKERRSEMLADIKDVIIDYFIDEDSPNSISSHDTDFPQRSLLTGNYYISGEDYEYSDSGEYIGYMVCFCISMTEIFMGKEKDYLGIDICAYFDSVDSEIDYVVISHNSI